MRILIIASAVSKLRTFVDTLAADCSKRLITEYNLLREKQSQAFEEEQAANKKLQARYSEAKAALARVFETARKLNAKKRQLKVGSIEDKLEAIDEVVDTLNI